ncbi:hypothetical protein AB0B31_15005 [Catellatospora citrea]|uniref:hypothetical protein n=1 Tax=Catellatospora citrea TaxID=53366 RepID=UPI0033BFFD6F
MIIGRCADVSRTVTGGYAELPNLPMCVHVIMAEGIRAGSLGGRFQPASDAMLS